MIVYLLLAEAQATLLRHLTFSDRVIYPAYAVAPGFPGSRRRRPALAGVSCGCPGSIAFTVPVLWLRPQSLGLSLGRPRGRRPRDDGDGDERQTADERRPSAHRRGRRWCAEAVDEQCDS